MANGNGYKAVIYDCDGVMFDSFEANVAFYSRILAQFEMPGLDRTDAEAMRVLHTYAYRDVMEFLFAGDHRKDSALRFASTIDYLDLVPLMVMEEGFLETIESLMGKYHLAICTNRSTSMETVLETFALADYFSCVMTASNVQNPKPHPEPLLKVLQHYRIEPGEALFVGDSEVDRLAALAAGVPFVAYKANLPAFARINRHAEILGFLD